MFGILILYLYGSSYIAHHDVRGHTRPAQDPFSACPQKKPGTLWSCGHEFFGSAHLEQNNFLLLQRSQASSIEYETHRPDKKLCCCHGAERSLWCCAAPAGRAGEGAAAQGKLPNRSSSHSSSFAVLPNTQIHHSPTRARAMLLQVPGMRPTQDVMSVPETGHAKGRVQRGSHSIHIFLTIVKVQMGKRRVVGSQGDMKSKRKK